jgi:DNA-binding IclR family transcriptional regulator
MSSGSSRLVQSVDRALTMLETLAGEPSGLSLTDLSVKTGLAAQTAQGLVRTLQHHGLVIQQGRGAPYTIGPGLSRLARTWHGVQDRAGLARPAVADLARRTGEYVILVELRGKSLFALVEAKSAQELAVAYEHCSIDRLHVMATGKVLLAGLEEDRRNDVLGRLVFGKYGSRAIGSRKQLSKELARVEKQGWAACRSEGSEGIGALGVPVCDAAGETRAAIGCSMPLSRLTAGRQKKLLRELKRTAREIGEIGEIW